MKKHVLLSLRLHIKLEGKEKSEDSLKGKAPEEEKRGGRSGEKSRIGIFKVA